jgi:TPR repeat protein
MIADMLQNKAPQMLKRMRLAVNENVPQKMYDLKSASEQDRVIKISNMAAALADDYSMEIESAYEIVNYFAGALGYKLMTVPKATEDAEVQFQKGNCYTKGEGGVDKDPVQAAYWYRKAAEQGYAAAQREFGLCYYDGIGVNKDFVQAVYWIRKAVEQGFAPAQNTLGFFYDRGEGVEKDPTQAVHWYRKAAEQGDARGQNNLGVCYKNKYDLAKAFYWFKKAAEQGNVSGQNNLGECYGRDTLFDIFLYEDSAKGVECDHAKAFYWFKKAAEQGDARGQSNLGFCYKNGNGVERDYVKALYWFKKAAEQGYVWAQNYLGRCYAHYFDDGFLEKNFIQAAYWYEKAAEQGDENAKNEMEYYKKNGRFISTYKDEQSKPINW